MTSLKFDPKLTPPQKWMFSVLPTTLNLGYQKRPNPSGRKERTPTYEQRRWQNKKIGQQASMGKFGFKICVHTL